MILITAAIVAMMSTSAIAEQAAIKNPPTMAETSLAANQESTKNTPGITSSRMYKTKKEIFKLKDQEAKIERQIRKEKHSQWVAEQEVKWNINVAKMNKLKEAKKELHKKAKENQIATDNKRKEEWAAKMKNQADKNKIKEERKHKSSIKAAAKHQQWVLEQEAEWQKTKEERLESRRLKAKAQKENINNKRTEFLKKRNELRKY